MKFGPMKAHRRDRLILVGLLVAAVAGAVAFALTALRQNVNLFYSPEQIVAGEAPAGQAIRAGGMVREGSVQRGGGDLSVSFTISDLQSAEVQVEYTGILPDLFREGQGVVVYGRLRNDGVFMAQEVLAKHDENYMPPEVADAISKAHKEAAAQANDDS